MVESISELRKICQTKYREISRSQFIHRAVSIHITRLILLTDITANQITMLGFLFGIVAVILITFTNILISFAGLLLLLLWALLDCVDGEVARYRGTMSVMGQYLDRLNSSIIIPLLFVSLTFRLYGVFHDTIIFVFGFSVSLAYLLFLLMAYSMYVSAGNTYLHTKGLGTLPKEVKFHTGGVGIDRIHSQVKSINPFVYDVINFLLPGADTGLPFILIVSFIIDLVVPKMVVGSFIFNWLYLCLAMYGIMMPLVCLVVIFSIIKDKSPEKLFLSLFVRDEKI